MLDELDLSYEDGETDMRGGRHRRRRSRGHRSLLTLILVVVLLGTLGGAGYWGVGEVRGFFAAADYSGSGHGSVQLRIKPGQGVAEIGNTLYNKDVVKSAGAFVNAAEDNPNGTSVQPGYYRVPKHMKASLALVALLDPGNRVFTKVTIPEGYTAKRILSVLSKKLHLKLSDLQKAAKNPKALGVPDRWYVRDDKVKPKHTVEGFLFPGTYKFDPGTTADDALGLMVQRFMSNAADTGLDHAPGVPPFEALIVASLVQAEGIESDFPKIARVVYNRLDSSDPSLRELHFDSTTNYWLDQQGKKRKDSRNLTNAQLHDTSNPYNTTEHEGLPPGPIDCPGADAMSAAVNPADGNWTYFVRIKKDGTSAFTNDYRQHQRNLQKAKKNGVG